MKKDINRIAIEMTVRRLLRDIQRSPKRGSRNLIDLVLSFSSSGFQGRLFTLIRDMLRNEDSAYYQLAKNVLASTDLETLTQFGMCVGYNSCTKGSRLIRSLEAEHHFNIPWALTLHMEHPLDRQREAAYASAVAQGMELGIYTYFIHMSGDCSPLLELFRKYTDCAFVLFLDGSVPQDAFLRQMKELHNVMLCVPAGEDTVQVCRILCKERLLYSVYVPYRAQDKERILDGSWLAPLMEGRPFFTVLLADDGCPQEIQQEIYRYVLAARQSQQYSTILADYRQDILAIDTVVSDQGCSAGFCCDGALASQKGKLEDPRFNLFKNSLRDILLAARL